MDKIKINIKASVEAKYGASLLMDKLNAEISSGGVTVCGKKGDCLNVSQNDGGYIIEYSILPEFFRGLAICVSAVRNGKFKPVHQMRQFETCGAMFDVSRNAVFKVDAVKDMIEYMALMGLNMMMLYTEDTYEMEKYPMFGFKRGRYTKEELKEIDAYAAYFGIELVPCIQTLAHLATTLKWSYTSKFKDTSDCLYVGKDETYQFIDDMFTTIKECFTSRKIHIGLDEANSIGLGKRLKEKGYTPAFELMLEHTNRVCELAQQHGLEPMMWSDMFFKFGHLGGDYDYTSKIPEDMPERLAKNVKLVYWDYCYENPRVADTFINKHRNELQREVIFAGGIWSWERMVPSYVKTFGTANGQLASCKKNSVKDVFVTIWNNNCSVCNLYSILPGLQMYAEHFYNTEVSMDMLSEMFEICTGYSFSDFMLLGLDDFSESDLEKYRATNAFCVNSSVQHFFNDVLIGLYDKTLSGYNFKSYYKRKLLNLENTRHMGKMNDLFVQTRILARIVYIKSYIGSDIVKAYLSSDKKKLSEHCSKLKELLALYKEYHKISMKIWHVLNKPFGWEGCDMLLGGVESRVESAIYRIEGFIDGTFENIPELEDERTYYCGCEKPLTETLAMKSIVTVNRV